MGALTSSDGACDRQVIPAYIGDLALPILVSPSNLSATAQVTFGDSFFFFVQEIFRGTVLRLLRLDEPQLMMLFYGGIDNR